MSKELSVFRLDPSSLLFLYAEATYETDAGVHVPGNCVQVAPPVGDGKVARWVTELKLTDHRFGREGTGAWEMVLDYRHSELYTVGTGEQYTVGSELEIDGQMVSYDGIGDLPQWLTLQPRPSAFHDWIDGKWVEDEQKRLEYDQTMARSWRDGEIQRVSWMRERHRDEVEQELPITLTEQAYQELLDYIQSLRDWPLTESFPSQSERPVAPDWLNMSSEK